MLLGAPGTGSRSGILGLLRVCLSRKVLGEWTGLAPGPAVSPSAPSARADPEAQRLGTAAGHTISCCGPG